MSCQFVMSVLVLFHGSVMLCCFSGVRVCVRACMCVCVCATNLMVRLLATIFVFAVKFN